MRKQIIYKGKNLLPIVLVLGTVFPMYGKSDSLRSDSKLIDKNSQNNQSSVIFIRKGTVLFNATQLFVCTDEKSSLQMKTFGARTQFEYDYSIASYTFMTGFNIRSPPY